MCTRDFRTGSQYVDKEEVLSTGGYLASILDHSSTYTMNGIAHEWNGRGGRVCMGQLHRILLSKAV